MISPIPQPSGIVKICFFNQWLELMGIMSVGYWGYIVAFMNNPISISLSQQASIFLLDIYDFLQTWNFMLVCFTENYAEARLGYYICTICYNIKELDAWVG